MWSIIGKNNYPADFQHLAIAIDFVCQSARQMGCDAIRCNNIELAIEEVITNVIQHAGLNHDQTIEVSCYLDGSVFIIQIVDAGIVFDPVSYSEDHINLSRSLENRYPGGCGILLVKKLMDELSYMRIANLNILTLKKNIG